MRFVSCGILLVMMLPPNGLGAAAGAATVTGRVIASGAIGKPAPLPVYKNRSFCGPSVANETLLIGKQGGVQNAVVLLWPKSEVASLSPVTISLDNQRCAFVPHVQIAPLGSELVLKNSDPILHTVHARIGADTLFNVGLPKWRQVTKRLDRAGVMRIDCDVLHTWMSAVIVVTTAPYFAVTDDAGLFSIGGLPAGVYDVQVWHERLGARKTLLHVDSAYETRLEAVFSLAAQR